MIDFNTMNITFGVSKGEDEIKIFVPPVSSDEIKLNALVLGQFASFMHEVNNTVLITDWEEYLFLSCEKVAKISSFKSDDLMNKVKAMIDRGIAGGYWYEGFTPIELSKADEDLKDKVRASLLFFIVARRYIFKLTGGESKENLEKFGYELISCSASEWGSILEKSLKEEKPLANG